MTEQSSTFFQKMRAQVAEARDMSVSDLTGWTAGPDIIGRRLNIESHVVLMSPDEVDRLLDVAEAAQEMREKMVHPVRDQGHSPGCATCRLCDALDRLLPQVLTEGGD